jgi:hypothetical protein
MIGYLVVGALAAACTGREAAGDPDVAAKIKIAKLTVRRYAYEAYPEWSIAHPDKACPASLDELREYVPHDDGRDPWGHAYQMKCGAAAPPAAKGFGVLSLGADGKPGGTGADADIVSWAD